MKIKTCKTKKDYYDRIFDIHEFCKEAANDKNLPGIMRNMDFRFWSSNEQCLLHQIYLQKKYRNKAGMLQLLYDKKRIIGVCGVERYNKDIAILGKRLYILQRYRKNQNLNRMFFPMQLLWAEKEGFKAALITINEYNERILKLVHILTQHPRLSPTLAKFNYYGKRKINNCIQDVFYYKIDKKYAMPIVFDSFWSKIQTNNGY